ncbi:hypothetical protein FACS1894177_00780 [Bacteroidia bacterium]|nr:hypothetical protein FACS1894177_00780 [Bacteroidia bacterium]
MAGYGGGNKQSTDELITVDVTKTNYALFADILSDKTSSNVSMCLLTERIGK